MAVFLPNEFPGSNDYMTAIKISEIQGRRVTLTLPKPVELGSYIIRARSFCVVTVQLEDGTIGSAFALDRGAPVSEAVNTLVAKPYQELFEGDPRVTWDRLLRQSSAALSSGAALRGFSLVDLAAHDAVARHEEKTVNQRFNRPNKAHPTWAVIGYPPSRGPEEIAWEVEAAVAAGAVGVKLPVGRSPELTRERIIAALDTKLCPVATDLAWSCRTPADAMKIVKGLDLAWVEDPFIPGSLAELRELRSLLDVPLSSGDDEAHLYHPQAFVETEAVDMLRMDATCQGGLSRLLEIDEYLVDSGLSLSWHVYDAWHSQIASILETPTFSIEYSAPGASVDPLAELIFSRKEATAENDLYGWKFTLPELPDVSMALDGGTKWIPIGAQR
jgi:L-alanine-DL-glutamate epimerase-like enolase superfamily enzyme